MDLDESRAFLALCETLHFTRAAGQLHMSPSALSRLVVRLEEAYGQPLFSRDRRHVRITRAGELVREHARSLLVAETELHERLQEEAQAPTGELRIACTVTACASLLSAAFTESRKRYPGLQLQLMTSDAVRAAQRFAAGEAELAVLPLPDAVDEQLVTRPLAFTELCFVAAAGDSRFVGLGTAGGPAFSEVPLILPKQGLERERLDRFLAEMGVQPSIYAEVSGNEAILAMVRLGCGVGLVPELVLSGSAHLAEVSVLPIAETPRGYQVAACVKARDLTRRGVAAFWDLLAGVHPQPRGA